MRINHILVGALGIVLCIYGTAFAQTVQLPSAQNLTVLMTGTTPISASRLTLVPLTNNGQALGTNTQQWSDLFLGSGGVINWNNGIATITHSASGLTLNTPLVVNTAGPSAIGRTALGYASLAVGGNFTGDGSSTSAIHTYFTGKITAANDDDTLLGMLIAQTSETGGGSDVYAEVAALKVVEPVITLGTGDSITAAATVIIANAPTEASANYALWVKSGLSAFHGSVEIGSAGVVLTGDGDGAITLLGAGNGSDEDLTLNLDDTADTGVFSSSTGLNLLTFTGITLNGAAYQVAGTPGCSGTPATATGGIVTACTGPEARPDVLLAMIYQLQAELSTLRAELARRQ